MKHKKTAANILNSNECHWSYDGKIDFDFFDFLGVFCRLTINIRIEVHLYYFFALGNERTWVACKSLRSVNLNCSENKDPTKTKVRVCPIRNRAQ